ncbi:MAG: ferredoxin [Patescibacteria group bacterium]|nr:ferredoxin [Patescibacteria group bacterium]MDD5491020.1 ferredoxin [Patescibacteria group bacterium]
MKVKVDKTKCIHCGTCVALAPKYFRFGEDGEIEVINEEKIPAELLKQVADSCPGQAISFEE